MQRIYEFTPIVINEYGIDLEYTAEETSFCDIVSVMMSSRLWVVPVAVPITLLG